ncbi:MAG TPA: PIN domain-containing protein [Armatimonadaceae bacterium]|jgi:predicted nucleic acid-binding protein|nr:PIN domain-containing protein [Armatimonadaceae bacterium]
MKAIFLDSHPLSLLCNPDLNSQVVAVTRWAAAMVAAGHRIHVPEVIDYELRRELLRAGKADSVVLLESLKARFYYVPITTGAMLRAAEMWAQARNAGLPTGDPKKLDIDVILAAQALTEAEARGIAPADVVIATSNVAHLARFVNSAVWADITP